MLDFILRLFENARFEQLVDLVGHLFGRIDPFTLMFAGILNVALYAYSYRRRLLKQLPHKLVCPKRGVDFEMDHYIGRVLILEEPLKVWYLARHNRTGNYVSLIGFQCERMFAIDIEQGGDIDFLPLSTFEVISSKINQTGLGVADLHRNECGPIWERIFQDAGFERIWFVQTDLPDVAGAHDHRGYLVLGWHKAHDCAELVVQGEDGPVLNLNSETQALAHRIGRRAANILEDHHYSKPRHVRIRESLENLLVYGRLTNG